MTAAGETIVAGRIPGERVATEIITADSATFTDTAVERASVTAPVVAGRTYRVVFHGSWASTVAGDTLFVRLREDSTTGTQLNLSAFTIDSTTAAGWRQHLEGEYTADATEDKEFIISVNRVGGSGTCRLEAGDDHPTLFYVEYVRG
jgi:hypothetical protein